MKKYFLFILTAILCSANVIAETWNAPTLSFTSWALGDTLYLYNVKAAAFLNASGGRTCISKSGMAVITNATADGMAYNLLCSSKGEAFTYLYTSDAQTANIGGSSTTAEINWTIVSNEDGTYKLRPDTLSASYGEGIYTNFWLGCQSDGTSIVYPLLSGLEHDSLTWKFVAKKDYQVYYYHTILSDAMTTAQNDGIDITTALTVYNNAASTYSMLSNATDDLNVLIRKYDIANATNDTPADLSDYIVNNSFSDGYKKDDSNIVGWTEIPSGTFGYSDISWGNTGAVGAWASNTSTLSDRKIFQKISGLPNGKYLISANILSVDQDQNDNDSHDGYSQGTYLYAISALGDTKVNCQSNRWWYWTDTDTIFVTDGNLELGVKCVNTTANWIQIDAFTLKFCGEYALREDLNTTLSESKTLVTEGKMNATYLDNLTNEMNNAQKTYDNTSSTTENVISADTSLKTVLNKAKENATAYTKLTAAFAVGDSILGSLKSETSQVDSLSDFIATNDISEILSNYALTTEEINQMLDKLSNFEVAAVNSQIQPGQDITSFIQNANLDNNRSDGWTIFEGKNPDFENTYGTKWSGQFHIYQTIQNVPNGTYKLKVQAFQRTNWNWDSEYTSWMADSAAQAKVGDSYIFINDNATRVKNVCSVGPTSISGGYAGADGWNMPNNPWDPSTTQAFFAAGYYDNEVEGFITDGNLTVGIKNDNGTVWTCFDNFRLIFEGQDKEEASKRLEAKIDEANILLDSKMLGTLRKDLSTATDKGTLILGSDTCTFDDMIDAMNKIINAENGVSTSIKYYAKMAIADSTQNSLLSKTGYDKTEAGIKLKALYDETNANYSLEYPTLTNDQITRIIAAYDSLAMKAKITNDVKEGVDITTVLCNPSFEDWAGHNDNISGVYDPPAGWNFRVKGLECTTCKEMNDAGLNSFTSLETNINPTDGTTGFCILSSPIPDTYIYQTVIGLPAGQYKVTTDMAVFEGGGQSRLASQRLFVNNNAEYYGHESDYNAEALVSEHPYEALRTFAGLDEYDPDNGEEKDKGPLKTMSITVDLAAGDTLTLGARTDGTYSVANKITGDVTGWNNCGWCKFDNFRLYNIKITDGVNTTKNNVSIKLYKVYDVNGIQRSKTQKGINIVKFEMSDGSSLTKKIIIK